MGKLDDPYFGTVKPDDTVDMVFNLSHGDDKRGPWNREPSSASWTIRSRRADFLPRR